MKGDWGPSGRKEKSWCAGIPGFVRQDRPRHGRKFLIATLAREC